MMKDKVLEDLKKEELHISLEKNPGDDGVRRDITASSSWVLMYGLTLMVEAAAQMLELSEEEVLCIMAATLLVEDEEENNNGAES